MAAIQSLIFNGKEEAIEYLYDIDLNQKIDGQQFMARYYDGNHKIASVIGIVHKTNGVTNIEIKDGEGGGTPGGNAVANDECVIKQPIKLGSKPIRLYYYQGAGIKFQMPSVHSGCSCNMFFRSGIAPYRIDDDNKLSNFNSESIKGLRTVHVTDDYHITVMDLIQEGSVVLRWYETGEGNYLRIENNSEHTLPKFCVTMRAGGRNGWFVRTDDLTAYWPTSEKPVVMEPNVNLHMYEHISVNQTYSPITMKTTAPGFLVEDGKIRCYRKSDFRNFIKEATLKMDDDRFLYHNIKMVKDGVVLFCHKRNKQNGLSPLLIDSTNNLLRSITHVGEMRFNPDYSLSGSVKPKDAYLRPKDGAIEYLSTIQKRKKIIERYTGPVPKNECHIYATYLGADEDGNLVFNFTKEQSTYDVHVRKLICVVKNINGETVEAVLRTSIQLSSNAGDYTVNVTRSFGGIFVYDAGLKVKNVVAVPRKGELCKLIGDAGGQTYRSRTRWKNATRQQKFYDRFDGKYIVRIKTDGYFYNHKFNRCRYIQKFKGVPSEFPELFYTR